MSISPTDIEQSVITFLTRANKMRDDFTADMSLYAGGVGLDSLETAELSAVLEDDFAVDPFATADMPQTLTDILAFYDSVPTEA